MLLLNLLDYFFHFVTYWNDLVYSNNCVMRGDIFSNNSPSANNRSFPHLNLTNNSATRTKNCISVNNWSIRKTF